MNDCDKSRRLSAYLDRELSAGDMSAMERHVAQCSVCATELDELRAVSVALHEAALPALSAGGMARLHRHVDQRSRRGAERLAGVLSALAACIAIVSGLSLLRAGQAAPAPLPWESYAVRITDDSSAANNRESTMAAWMVADLSPGSADGE